MQLSPKILRGLKVKGWKTYEPRISEEPGDNFADDQELDAEEQLPPPPSREEMEKERAEILTAARKAGEQLRRDALTKVEKEAAVLREQAEQKGYQEGFTRGEQAAAKLQQEAAHTLKLAKEEHLAMLDGAQGEMLKIAVSMAEKLLNVQLEVNEDAVLAMIIRSLEALPGGREVVLHVSPQDEPLCRDKIQELQGQLRKDVSLQIVADEAVSHGSCIVASEEAEVSFLLQEELKILAKKLLGL